MSLQVALDELAARVEAFGPLAFMVTVNDDGTPHVVSVAPRYEQGRLRIAAGRRTRRNLERSPVVTLAWPSGRDPEWCLLVDGAPTPSTDDGDLLIEPNSAVLHRVAGTPRTDEIQNDGGR